MSAPLIPTLALVPTGLLRWFDENPFAYWGIAWAAWAVLAALVFLRLAVDWHPAAAVGSRVPSRWLRPGTFLLVAVVAIAAFRWPLIFSGPLPNPDETQLGAGAQTLWLDPVPWRSVDLHTSGPLNGYLLWPALLLHGRVDYAGLRLAALAAHLIAALAAYGFLRRFMSEGLARLGALPLLSFVAFTSLWEFIQYSSEQLSVALLGVGAWLLAEAVRPEAMTDAARQWRLRLAGFALGCLPFCKMQSVMLGLMLGAFGLLVVWLAPATPRGPRLARIGSLLLGAVGPVFLVGVVLTVYGLWAQFQAAYLESNSTYLEGYDGARMLMLRNFVPTYLGDNFSFAPYFWGTVAVAALALVAGGLVRAKPRLLLPAAWLVAVAGVWTVVFPGRPFWHYLHFLLLPLAWLSGLSLAALVRLADGAWTGRRAALARWGLAAGFVGVVTVPQILARVREPHPAIGSLVARRLASLHPVSARLRELAQPGDTLFVWGWFPRLYTESGLPQGTREAQTGPEMDPRPMRQFYRDRTLSDLKKHAPTFIVDAVCEGSFTYVDRKTDGLPSFPELQAYVEANYRLTEDLGGYQLYLRNDRAK